MLHAQTFRGGKRFPLAQREIVFKLRRVAVETVVRDGEGIDLCPMGAEPGHCTAGADLVVVRVGLDKQGAFDLPELGNGGELLRKQLNHVSRLLSNRTGAL